MKIPAFGILIFAALEALALTLHACGPAKGAGIRHAEVIPSNDGATCYAIVDENNEVKGGNCK